jgi:excisionase family DNA binding protein
MPKTATKEASTTAVLPPRRRGPEPLVSLGQAPEWLTIPEAAALVRSSRKSIQRMVESGRLHVFEISPRKRLIRVDEIQALIRPRQKAPGVVSASQVPEASKEGR